MPTPLSDMAMVHLRVQQKLSPTCLNTDLRVSTVHTVEEQVGIHIVILHTRGPLERSHPRPSHKPPHTEPTAYTRRSTVPRTLRRCPGRVEARDT